MFNERVGFVNEYNENIGLTGGVKLPEPNNSYWQKLSDYYSKMSADQQNFVNSNKKVLKYKAKMMEAFSLFIFERYKDDFVQLNCFRKLCDDYVDAVIASGQEYSEQIAKIVDENQALKAKVAELERKQNEQKSDTK